MRLPDKIIFKNDLNAVARHQPNARIEAQNTEDPGEGPDVAWVSIGNTAGVQTQSNDCFRVLE